MSGITIKRIPFADYFTTEHIIQEVFDEIASAIGKHPIWPTDHVHRAAIISEEAGEVVREANHLREGHGSTEDLRNELIQTAGTCLRMLYLMDEEYKLKNAYE